MFVKVILWICYTLDNFLWMLSLIKRLLMLQQGYRYFIQGYPSWSYVFAVDEGYWKILISLMVRVSPYMLSFKIYQWHVFWWIVITGFIFWIFLWLIILFAWFNSIMKITGEILVTKLSLLTKDITNADNDWLTTDIAEEEVRQTVFQLRPLNVLGPNGTHAVFFHKC